jgi:hypothetical protein
MTAAPPLCSVQIRSAVLGRNLGDSLRLKQSADYRKMPSINLARNLLIPH